MRADHYDSFAQSYARDNESGLFNAHYARPAMIALAGDVDGHRVLDAGCGSGPLSEALRAKGALVTGFDSSPVMLELARQRLGDDADLHVADISQPLPFDDGAFDDVVFRSCCTTSRTGRPRWLSYDAFSSPADASFWRSTTPASSKRATPKPTTSLSRSTPTNTPSATRVRY